MKTAMQLLIEDFKAIWKDGYDITAEAAIKLCETHLGEEKQQIVDAYKEGVEDGIGDQRGSGSDYENGEDYYSKVYKTN